LSPAAISEFKITKIHWRSAIHTGLHWGAYVALPDPRWRRRGRKGGNRKGREGKERRDWDPTKFGEKIHDRGYPRKTR